MQTIAVLLTCHNRAQNTLKCLSHLYSQKYSSEVCIVVYLVDDGSTDGTGDSVRELYPEVRIIDADGSMFWNRGMHKAFSVALQTGFDYFLWLNDDTYLYPEALQKLLNTNGNLTKVNSNQSIVIASTRDSRTGEFTYGGYRRVRKYFNPLKFESVLPGGRPISCDTMCGNCVMIPREVADVVGNIDPCYRHRWGDVDYGLRAGKNRFDIWIAAGYLADCDSNPNEDRWRDRTLSFRCRLKELHSLKGLGKEDWFRFVRKHGGMFWPLVWVRPYIRLIYDSFV